MNPQIIPAAHGWLWTEIDSSGISETHRIIAWQEGDEGLVPIIAVGAGGLSLAGADTYLARVWHVEDELEPKLGSKSKHSKSSR